jgi:hypothetical protein
MVPGVMGLDQRPDQAGPGRNPTGVGSRFRATIHHMETALPENDFRPPRRNATRIHLPVF